MGEPTPLPWTISDLTSGGPAPMEHNEYDPDRGYIHVMGPKGEAICDLFPFGKLSTGHKQSKANAALIVNAVNMHGRLAQALADVLAEWDEFSRYGSPIAHSANETVNNARALLAEAEKDK